MHFRNQYNTTFVFQTIKFKHLEIKKMRFFLTFTLLVVLVLVFYQVDAKEVNAQVERKLGGESQPSIGDGEGRPDGVGSGSGIGVGGSSGRIGKGFPGGK